MPTSTQQAAGLRDAMHRRADEGIRPYNVERTPSHACHCEGACACGNLPAQQYEFAESASVDVKVCSGDCHALRARNDREI